MERRVTLSAILIAGMLAGTPAWADLSGSLRAKFTRAILKTPDIDPSQKLSLSASLRYPLDSIFRLQATSLGVEKNITAGSESELELTNPNLKLTALWGRFGEHEAVRVESGASMTLPFNTESRKVEGLLYGLGFNTRASFNLLPYRIRLKGYYDLTFTRLFHSYMDAVDGEINTQYQLAHTISITVPGGGWNLTCRGKIGNAWTYFGVYSSNFSVTSEITFELSDSLTVAAGHQLGVDWRVINGRSLDLSSFSNDSSKVYLGTYLRL